MQTSDFVIVGAGIIGLSAAYQLLKRDKNLNITIIEKEADVALHASGRNSGVLHSGVYYSKDSLKAKFVIKGNVLWREFCEDHKITINPTGKLILCKDAADLEHLHALAIKAAANGATFEVVSAAKAQSIEPLCYTYKKAIFCPLTATVDPVQVCLKLKEILINQGVDFQFNQEFSSFDGQTVDLQNGKQIKANYLVNCAGLYADKIAHQMGAGKGYTILPFKGYYYKVLNGAIPLKTNLYPVPNPKWPFLGVYFTVTASGDVKLGPSALPALWRENYNWSEGFKLKEFCDIALIELKLLLTNSFNFRALAWNEIKKIHPSLYAQEAMSMLKNSNPQFSLMRMRPGIRAQLVHKKSLKLVDDFVIEKQANILHVLNAVSPAFTCGLAFAEYLVDEIYAN
jgi:L-2-hydroxyglutarate oxidase